MEEIIYAAASLAADITLSELCRSHLNEQAAKNELKPKSIDRRECTIEQHIAKYVIGDYMLCSVTPECIDSHINCLIQEGKLSDSSIEKVLDVINAAYNWGIRKGYVLENPVSVVKKELVKKYLSYR